jgi:hypothetical protein
MMTSDESGMITVEKWIAITVASMACSNSKVAAGPNPLCVSGWRAPSKFSDDMFDKTEKHRYNLQMRLSAAGLKP